MDDKEACKIAVADVKSYKDTKGNEFAVRTPATTIKKAEAARAVIEDEVLFGLEHKTVKKNKYID